MFDVATKIVPHAMWLHLIAASQPNTQQTPWLKYKSSNHALVTQK